MDWATLNLETKTDDKSLSGGALSTLRGVSNVDFGTTTTGYNASACVTTSTAVRGSFTATETRTNFLANSPLYQDMVKTLVDSSSPAILGSGQLGSHYVYDGTVFHWLKAETDYPTGLTTSYVPDDFGRVIQVTDPHGIVTTTTYDAWGRVAKVTRLATSDVDACSTSTTYDPNGTWTEVAVSGAGQTMITRTTVDGYGNVIRVDHRDGTSTFADFQTTTWDAFGRKLTQSPVMKVSRNVTQTPYGNTTWLYLDPLWRLTEILDPLGNPLLSIVPPAWGTTGAYTGIVTTKTDDQGGARTEVRDLLGQLFVLKDPLKQVTQFKFDQDGHIATAIQGAQSRSYSYNGMGWLVSRTEPEEGTTTFSNFTITGFPTCVVKKGLPIPGNGGPWTTTTSFTGQLLPNLITVTGPEGTLSRNLTWDPATCRLTDLSETQSNGQLNEHYGYDGLGRPNVRAHALSERFAQIH